MATSECFPTSSFSFGCSLKPCAQSGDYLFGWKGDALQKAMDGHCANDNCAPLKRQTDAQAVACTKRAYVAESIGDGQCELIFYRPALLLDVC